MNALLEQLHSNKIAVAFVASILCGVMAEQFVDVLENNPLYACLAAFSPPVAERIRAAYLFDLYSTPFLLSLWLISVGYIYLYRVRPDNAGRLPPYPEPRSRKELQVVLGELHNATSLARSAAPRWLLLLARGLYTGTIAFGAIGSGKTSAVMHPFNTQLFSYAFSDPVQRLGGLILEVKGNFCLQVKALLDSIGRGADYVEVSLDSPFVYNPLRTALSPSALASGVASLMNNLYGHGKEPFWQQAYTNMVKFIVLLHRLLYNYVTFFDIYHCAINHDLLRERIDEAQKKLVPGILVVIDPEAFLANKELDRFEFTKDRELLYALKTDKLEATLKAKGIPYREQPALLPPNWDAASMERFYAVKRWYDYDWQRLDKKLQAAIVEGISVFLSTFDDPLLRRVFCPPREAFDPEANSDFRFGQPLPPFSELFEDGRVCALNFPQSIDPGTARTIGTMMKLSFQRDLLNRIPRMAKEKHRHFRPVVFICDEYQAFVTCGGEGDPTGDDKFFSLSREAKCVSLVATQSMSSLQAALGGNDAIVRTLLQCFRTKIFLSTTDHATARFASDLCGEHEILRPSYTITENGQETKVSTLTGRAGAPESNISIATTYSLQKVPRFEPSAFYNLKNAQSIVLAYDGTNPLPSTYCYLKPAHLDPNLSYFEQEEQGLL